MYSSAHTNGKDSGDGSISNLLRQHVNTPEQPKLQHSTAIQELAHKDVIRNEVLPQSPALGEVSWNRTPLDTTVTSAAAATQPDDVYVLLDNASSTSSDSDAEGSSASFMRVRSAGAMLTAAGQGASSIMQAIDALKDGSRQPSTVQLHTRTPEAGNGLPFAGLIDAATGKFRFAPGTSSSHFVRYSLSDAVNAQLPRLYPVSAPEMHIKRFWDQKKGCWCQRWVSVESEKQTTVTGAFKKQNGNSFTAVTNLSPNDTDTLSGSGRKYRHDECTPANTFKLSSPQNQSASAATSKTSNVYINPVTRSDQEVGSPGKGNGGGTLHSGISYLGHDARSMAASATAPHMWRSWGAAAVRVHAQHAVSASCLYREIRAHAENLDEALHHLAESCSVWHHGYSVLQTRCALTSQKLYMVRCLRVVFNVWKHVVSVNTFTLRVSRQRALQTPKLKQLFHSWRLFCLSSRVRVAIASMFTTR
jgi:hypothetical protein